VFDQAILILGGLLAVAGIIGSVVPVLPGPPLSYAGLILLQVSSRHPFTVAFLVTYAIITILVSAVDFIIPVYSAKKYSSSRLGAWGSAVGLLSGLFFFPPFGIIIGAVAGAFLGELVSGRRGGSALRAAAGSLAGLLAGSVIKIALSVLMAYHFFSNLF
jgi:uncharacterized protein YqgC (DUF456 family)